jgi:tRNA (guanine-N7-)-methyltransferase
MLLPVAHSLSNRGKTLDVGEIGISQEDLPPFDAGHLDLRGWFGPERANLPLELEIGSGKGTFLVQQATQTPDVNYIGIEYAKAYWRHAADRCRRHQLANVRMLYAEAGAFVRNYVPDGCLRQVHVYFPDPWPKARHHKRRLVQPGTVELLADALRPGGVLRLATDVAGYAEQMQRVLGALPDLEPLGDDGRVARYEGRPVTKYERAGLAAGRRPVDLAYRRSTGRVGPESESWRATTDGRRPAHGIEQHSTERRHRARGGRPARQPAATDPAAEPSYPRAPRDANSWSAAASSHRTADCPATR